MARNLTLVFLLVLPLVAQQRVQQYSVFEAGVEAAGEPANPYVSASGEATFTRPDGRTWRVPLFWDGGKSWKVRVSPDSPGKWTYRIDSADAGLNGKTGAFECLRSARPGGLRPMGSHFRREGGKPVWFLADTAWGYFTDSPEDKHHRAQAEHFVKTRAAQGFNAIQCMMMSEQGVGNNNGLPFTDIAAERINPAYWREVDQRLAFANAQGLTVGLAVAWGNKRNVEPFSWGKLPDLEARKRYARYIAARYAAYDVYFIVSGEWHGEIRTRPGAVEERIYREFVEIGDTIEAADPHDRMIAIHPMTGHGSVREFASTGWMSFGDFQQNYNDLHARILLSRRMAGPVVNAEYGYLLRDSDGDGKPDKSNSYSTEDMRFASWDIVTAGGYLVNGFGTTYFAGHRDPGPFDVDAQKNDEWEAQIGYIRKLFETLEWWRLIPADELIASEAPRTADRSSEGRNVRPPQTTYWAMSIPGELYLLYVRGTKAPIELNTAARARTYTVRQFNPRTGETSALADAPVTSKYRYAPPDTQDWVAVLKAQ